MLLLTDFQTKVLKYAKSMPESGKAEDLDFKVWGKGFCSLMVRHPFHGVKIFDRPCSLGGIR
jgi:hypothetical protein